MPPASSPSDRPHRETCEVAVLTPVYSQFDNPMTTRLQVCDVPGVLAGIFMSMFAWVRVASLVGWFCPSLSTHAKVGRRPPLCHPDRSVAKRRDLLFALDGETEHGGNSHTALSLCPKAKLQIPPLRCATVGMTKWRAAAHLGMGGEGRTESAQRQPTGFVCPRSLQRPAHI
jgi:hypothetical protein